MRYRRPYTARHSSVSWNLMIGKNPLWVAKQHGHSIATMLRVYAAWADGAVESDIEAIKRSMDQATAAVPVSVRIRECCRYGRHSMRREGIAPVSRNLAVDLSLGAHAGTQVISKLLEDFAFQSPAVPSHPRICHQFCHQKLSAPMRDCPVS